MSNFDRTRRRLDGEDAIPTPPQTFWVSTSFGVFLICGFKFVNNEKDFTVTLNLANGGEQGISYSGGDHDGKPLYARILAFIAKPDRTPNEILDISTH